MSELFTTKQLSARIHLCEESIRRMTREGILPFVAIGPRSRRYELDAVMTALANRKPGTACSSK